jgi:predicted lipoprotein with Yx(FWY)xxD motif
MATVQGKREQILADAKGMALYYFTPDTPTKAACTGGCAKTWPPLLSKAMPTHAVALSGKFGVVNDANGRQVSYNGHLLYRYSGDTAPGQAAGNGLYGKWFVAKPGLTSVRSRTAP